MASVAPAYAAAPVQSPVATSTSPRGGADAAIVQGLNGALIGVLICDAGPRCFNEAPMVSVTAGTAAGALVGYFVGRELPRGAVMAVDTGMLIGGMSGLILTETVIKERRRQDDWGFDEDLTRAQYVIGGEVIGALAFGALAYWQRPRPERVSMANSAGLWAMSLGTQAEFIRDRSPQWWGPMVMFGLGYTVGWVGWDELPLRRDSVWKIDAGGVLGTVMAMIYTAQADDSKGFFNASLIGCSVGLLAGAYFAMDDAPANTAGLDDEPLPVSLSVLPRHDGAVFGLHGSF